LLPSGRVTPLHHEVPTAHLTGVTVSMRVMSAGDGYKYLLQSVAAGDGHRPLTTPLVAYYTEKGTRRAAGSVPAASASASATSAFSRAGP
jgi:hypothetical protein